MGSAECVDHPMAVGPSVSDQRADTDNRVVDQLGKFITQFSPPFVVALAVKLLAAA